MKTLFQRCRITSFCLLSPAFGRKQSPVLLEPLDPADLAKRQKFYWRDGLDDRFNVSRKTGERRTKMKTVDVNSNNPSYWQAVFLHSKVNGAIYNGEALPRRNWNWPKNTYLQRRLRRHQESEPAPGLRKLPNSYVPSESVPWLVAGGGRGHKLRAATVPFYS